METTSWQAVFSRILNFPLFNLKSLLCKSLIYWFWSLLDQSSVVFEGPKRRIQDGCRLKTKCYCDVIWTSSADVADICGNIFGRTICPLSFVAIALIFSELKGGGGIPPQTTRTKQSPVWLGLIKKLAVSWSKCYSLRSCSFSDTRWPPFIWCNSYVRWRHRLMLQTSKERILNVLYAL